MLHFKKALAFILAVCMLFSMASVGINAQTAAASETGYTELVLDTPQEAVITNSWGTYFAFTPETDGYYVFESDSERDTCAYLYDSEMNKLAFDDDSGEEKNFSLKYTLTAGETYIYRAKFYNNSGGSGSYNVMISLFESPIESIEVEPIQIIERTNGYENYNYNEETGEKENCYYYYDVYYLDYKITYKDGSVDEGENSGFYYNNEWYSFNVSTNQSYENQWTAGNTYKRTITVFGEEYEFDVEIVESPISSIEIKPIQIIERTNGWESYDYNSETGEENHYYYYGVDYLDYKITYKDGSVDEGSDSGFYYNNEWYSFNISTNQSYQNQWTVGNTYKCNFSALGKEYEFDVEIIESPIESIEVEPIQIIERTNGYEDYYYNYETGEKENCYYYYDVGYLDYKITYKDGSVDEGNGSGFCYNDEWYDFNISTNQSYESKWTAGNTYKGTITVFGKEYEFDVEIIDSPISSIEVEPIQKIENTGGYYSGSSEEQYYCYSIYSLDYKITYKDGSVDEGNGSGFYYNDEWYSFNVSTNQSYENQWTVGNTYKCNFSALGKEYEFEVEIIDSPISSIEFKDIEIIENTNCDTRYGYNEETGEDSEYTFYYIHPEYKITFKDGNVLEGTGSWFEYNDEEFNIILEFTQDYNNQWTVGNTYTVKTEITGITSQYNISIVEAPITSLSIKPLQIVEGTNGYMQEVYDEETDEYIGEYFRYEFYGLSCDIVLKDGTVYENCQGGIDYNGFWYSFYVSCDQSYNNQWGIGTHDVTLKFMGKEYEFTVEIIDSPISSIEVEPIKIFEGTNGYEDYDYDEETGEEINKYFRYWVDGISYKITFIDGSVVETSDNGFYYKDEWYDFNISTNQSYENQWTAGNTYTASINVFGKEYECINVEITQSPVADIEIEDFEIIAGTGGYVSTSYGMGDIPTRYYYYWADPQEFKVIFRDGTVAYGEDGGFEYNGEWCSLGISSEQSYYNQWTAGNTYTATASLMGKTVQYNVTIVESPVVDVEIEDIEIIEGTKGYYAEEYDYETDEWVEFFYYDLNRINYNVVFEDGTVEEADGHSIINHDNKWYDSYIVSNQSYENKWTVGNTYTATIVIGGKEYEFDVKIGECPIESVEISDVELIENFGGWTDYYDDDTYYYYYPEYLTYKITLKDGEIIEGTGSGFEYNEEWYEFNISTINQSYENQWTVGNTYTAEAEVMNTKTQFNVKIAQTPAVSVEVEDVVLSQDNLWYEEIYDETTDSWYSYTYYDIGRISYKITLKDGTVLEGTGRDMIYNGSRYYFEFETDQSYENQWQVGGTYTATTNIMNIPVDFNVTIADTSKFSYFTQEGGVVVYDCTLTDEIIRVPSEIYGMPVTAVVGLESALPYAKEIELPDSVIAISEYLFAGNTQSLKTIKLGESISDLNANMFSSVASLENIIVSEQNENYCSVDGVVYNQAMDTVVAYPLAKGNVFNVPDSVTNIDIFNNPEYAHIQLIFSENSEGFIVEDGITYNADKTKVISCDSEKTGKYIMPDSVTEIAEFAFANSNLTSVKVSPNVTDIVYCAFISSFNLENVELPDELESISEFAFAECESLSSIELPEELIVLGDSSFAFSGVESVVIPSSVGEIGNSAFAYSKLATLEIKEGVDAIGCSSFANTSIKKLIIPNSIVSMGSYAFADCESLKSVSIGSGLESISEYCFEGAGLTSIVIPQNVTAIWEGAFRNSSLTQVDLVNDAIYIGESAFANCPLKEIKLGDKITEMGRWAFMGTDIKEVTLPDGVTDIAYGVFSYSENLTDIDIPDNVTRVRGRAFHHTAWYDAQPDGLVYLENVLYKYKGRMPEDTNVVVKNGTTVIADYAFNNDYEYGDEIYTTGTMKTIDLPEGLKTIGEYAFFDCVGLESITIPKTVEFIGWGAFEFCDSLQNVYYTGTEEEWNNIYIDYDCCLPESVNIHFESKHYYPKAVSPIVSEAKCNSITLVKVDGCEYSMDGVNWQESNEFTSLEVNTEYTFYQRYAGTDTHVVGEISDKLTALTAAHSYKNACDGDCDNCGATRTPAKHVYNNACDKTCNVCGATRTVGAHKYTNSCDATCNICGTKRTIKHTYSNACDTSCNVCKATRIITHTYKTTTTKATTAKNGSIVKKCSVCAKSTKTTISYAKTFKLSTTTYTYDGKVKTPTVTVKDAAGKTISSSNYTVNYASGRKNVGKYKVTVTLKGNYSGTKTLYLTINPAKTTVSKLTAAKKSIKVAITKKSTQVTGYQIQYSTSKTFKSAKTKTITSYKTTSTTLTKLTAKKTYYVRVRTYKTVNGVKYYSGWSTYKSAKTK